MILLIRLFISLLAISGTATGLYFVSQNTGDNESQYFAPFSTERLENKLKELVSDKDITSIATSPDLVQSISTLSEAIVRRNKRSSLGWFGIALHELENGNQQRFVSAYSTMMRLQPELRQSNVRQFVLLSLRDDFFDAISSEILLRKPRWGVPYLSELVRLRIRPLSRTEPLFAVYPDQQFQFINSVYQAYGAEQAFWLQERLVPGSTLPSGSFASDFAQVGRSVFDWQTDAQFVSIEPDGQAVIYFGGRGNPEMLHRVIKSDSGRHRLSLEIYGNSSRNDGYFHFESRCLNGAKLGTIDIDELSATSQTVELEIDVPATGCEFLRLSISGRAGSFPRRVQAFLSVLRKSAVQ